MRGQKEGRKKPTRYSSTQASTRCAVNGLGEIIGPLLFTLRLVSKYESMQAVAMRKLLLLLLLLSPSPVDVLKHNGAIEGGRRTPI